MSSELTVIVEMDGYEPVQKTFQLDTPALLGGESTGSNILTLRDIQEVVHNGEFTMAWVNEHLLDKTLTTDILKNSILEKYIPLVGDLGVKYVPIISNLIESGTFDLSTLEIFIQEDIFGDATKDVKQIYNVIKKSIENKTVDIEGIKTLVVDNALKIDFVQDLVKGGWIEEKTLQDLVKDGRVNGNAIAELVTHGLLNVDFVQDLGKKGYIDIQGFQDAISKLDFSTFDTIKDPDTLESIARGILPEKYKDWAVVAGDIVRQPNKAIYEAGEKALDLAGSELTAYIQGPGQETAKVLLDSIPGIGTFFKTTGLDSVITGTVGTLAVQGVNKLTSWIGGKLGFKAKKKPPAPKPVSFNFTGAPKVVYALNESFTSVNIQGEVKMSDGTTKNVDFSELNMSGFDSHQYTEDRVVSGVLKDTTSQHMTFTLKGSDLKIDYPYIVAKKFLNGVRLSGNSSHKNRYIVGENFDPTGLVLKASFTDNTEMEVPSGSVVISGFRNDVPGNQIIKAWYGGEYYTEISVDVYQETPKTITLERVPDKTIFYVNEDFNIHGIYVTATYEINGTEYTYPVPSGLLEVKKPSTSHKESGIEVLISYMGRNVSYAVDVIDQSFDFLQIQNKPFKRKFRPGEKFTTDGLVVVGIMGDLTRMIVDPDLYTVKIVKTAEQIHKTSSLLQGRRYKLTKSISENYVRGYLQQKEFLNTEHYFTDEDIGSTLTVEITSPKNLFEKTGETLTTSYEIDILPEREDFLRYKVTKLPNKVIYNIHESLDITGLEISALYGTNSDPNKDPKYDHVLEEVVINNESFEFEPLSFETINLNGKKDGSIGILCTMTNSKHKDEHVLKRLQSRPIQTYVFENDVDITEEGSVCTFPVRIVDGNMEAIQVNVLPKTNYLYGEEFDINGLEVVGIYSNGYKWVIPNEKLEFSGFSSRVPRHLKIDISYPATRYMTQGDTKTSEPLELHTNYTVHIQRGNIESIAIKKLPNKTKYYPKEPLDIRGLEVLALYNSGYIEKVSLNDTRLKILGYYSYRVKKVVPVTVDFHGFRAVFCVSVVQRNIHHISLEAPPNNVVYVAGRNTPANWIGMRVLAHNTVGGTTLLDLDELTIVGFDSDNPYGLIECSVDYEGYTDSYSTTLNLFVLEGEVTKIHMKSRPIKTEYGLYDEFDDTGLVVELECEGSVVPRIVPNNLLIIRGFDTSTMTSEDEQNEDYVRTCTVTIGGVHTDPLFFTYKVSDYNFKGLMLQEPTQRFLPQVYESVFTETGPNETTVTMVEYPLDLIPYDTILVEQYDTNHGVYEKVLYFNEIRGNEEEYTCSCKEYKINDNPAGYQLKITKTGIGSSSGVLSYVFGTVLNQSLTSPSIPNKTNYLLGEDLKVQTSMTIECRHPSYTTNYTDKVKIQFSDDYSDTEEYYTHYGFSIIKPDMTYSGSKTVKITSGMGHSWTYDIDVVSPSDIPIGLEMVSEPDKVDYNLGDQEIDLTGLELYQVYDDGTKIPISNEGIEVSTFDTSVIGTTQVVITYNQQLHTTYDIYVHAVPTSLYVLQYPDHTVYYPNEEVDLTGLVIQAEYMDEYGHLYTEDVSIEDCIVHDFDTSYKIWDEQKKEWTYIQKGVSVSRLFSVEYRGSIIFIPFTLTVEDPSYVSVYPIRGVDSSSGHPILDQRQTKIYYTESNGTKTYATRHLDDITVELFYPNGSKVKRNLEELLKEISTDGTYNLKSKSSTMMHSLQSSSSRLRNDPVQKTLNIFGYEFIYNVEEHTDGYNTLSYRGLLLGDASDNTIQIVMPQNSIDVSFDMVFTIKNGNNTETYHYTEHPEYFENVPLFNEIGIHSITDEILFIKDGYVVELKQ